METTTIRIDRLEQIEAHLRTGVLGHDVFDFTYYNDEFEHEDSNGEPLTCGCAVGEFPTIWPDEWYFNDEDMPTLVDGEPITVERCAMEWLGLPGRQAYGHLFMPGEQVPSEFGGRTLRGDATKEAVADNIRAFIEWSKSQQ